MIMRSMRLVCFFLLQALASAQAPAGSPPAPRFSMTTYQLVMLKAGPAAANLGATPAGQELVQQHIAYMYKLAADGHSMAAGPFLDGGDITGIIVMKAATPERAHEIESEDPAVKAGLFTVEAAPFMAPEGWFGKWAEAGKFETVFFGFLNSGSNRSHDADTTKRLQSEHLAYMDGQANQGKLVLAGPFTSAGTRRGVVVYRVGDPDEAKLRAEGDPMIKAGRLAVELHPWQVPQGALPTTPK